MKYRKTFREALNDVEKKDKPESKPEVADEKPVEDKDAIIKKLQDEIQQLKLQATVDKTAAQPNKETGEVIKQIPEEEFLRLTNRISDFNKNMLDQTV